MTRCNFVLFFKISNNERCEFTYLHAYVRANIKSYKKYSLQTEKYIPYFLKQSIIYKCMYVLQIKYTR